MTTPCKNFMIGDWIEDRNQFPMQVVSVGENWLNATFEENEGDVFEYDDNINPPEAIEITPEIIRNNHLGWLVTTDEMQKLKYVHKIQQFLRLTNREAYANRIKL